MNYMPVVAALALSACGGVGDPTGVTGRMNLQYRVGEELMTDCNDNGQRCVEWLAFKTDFEEGVSYLTTFESSLARHKARVAAGGSI
jgi:hypothetical protein